mmetsp:Transcript_41835/g.133475  ORF Transcript_41835/g.133475 Transcript_41835/m.133475 type:complete len:254 (+) Transcript_41835:195-956(+)
MLTWRPAHALPHAPLQACSPRPPDPCIPPPGDAGARHAPRRRGRRAYGAAGCHAGGRASVPNCGAGLSLRELRDIPFLGPDDRGTRLGLHKGPVPQLCTLDPSRRRVCLPSVHIPWQPGHRRGLFEHHGALGPGGGVRVRGHCRRGVGALHRHGHVRRAVGVSGWPEEQRFQQALLAAHALLRASGDSVTRGDALCHVHRPRGEDRGCARGRAGRARGQEGDRGGLGIPTGALRLAPEWKNARYRFTHCSAGY